MTVNGMTLIILSSIFLQNHEYMNNLLNGNTGTIEFNDGLLAVFFNLYFEDNLKNLGAIYLSFSFAYLNYSEIKILQCTFLNQSSIMGASISIINFSKSKVLIHNSSFFLNLAQQRK